MLRKQLEGVQCHSLLWNVAGSAQSKGVDVLILMSSK